MSSTHFGFESVDERDKARRVRGVFDSVAPRYDLMNDLMSMGLHRAWKAYTVLVANVREGQQVLDIAGGTGDLALALARKVGLAGQVIHTDINEAMLRSGRDRLLDAGVALPTLVCDAEKLPFPDHHFDLVSVAFGLRNMTRKEAALAEMHRVLKLGGKLLVLEFSKVPQPVAKVYEWYSFKVLPRLGQLVAGNSPFALQGAGAGAESAQAAPQYSPDKVGNDASARPWERNSMAFDSAKAGTAGTGVQIGSALGGAGLGGSQNWGVPPGFDTDGFLAAAKRNFVTLQDAWDRSDVTTLRSMMTDDMLVEIRTQLAEREGQKSGEPNKTEVVMIEAQLLGIEDLGADYMASVEFSGMIREDSSAGPSPFREVWNMTKPKSGNSGWLVAGVQALQ